MREHHEIAYKFVAWLKYYFILPLNIEMRHVLQLF